jgi:hypothetical protein
MNQIIYIFTIVLISYALTGCSSGDFEVQDKGDSPDISEPSDQTTPLELKVQKDVIYQATGNWDPAFPNFPLAAVTAIFILFSTLSFLVVIFQSI